jgi:transcriptional regulator with PAS, ATPase and Fis domain
VELLEKHNWPGNIRELKNFTEKLSIIEEKRILEDSDVSDYLLSNQKLESALIRTNDRESSSFSEREILYKILFDLKNDLNDLKKITLDLIQSNNNTDEIKLNNAEQIRRIYNEDNSLQIEKLSDQKSTIIEEASIEENLSLQDNECEMIQKALEKNHGKRKIAAEELGISERTLYRKIKQYEL